MARRRPDDHQWIEGSFEDFIKASQAGYDGGVRFLHFLGGTTIDLKRNRAIAQTKQMISYRVTIDGVLCDVVCTGRFYFFLEKRKGRWGIVLFQPILEKDRLDLLDPSATLKLDGELLARYPEGYRHLAYALVRAPARRCGPMCRAWTAPPLTLSTHEEPLGSRASRLNYPHEAVCDPGVMSLLGHKRTFRSFRPMSALPPKADIRQRNCDVRFVPFTTAGRGCVLNPNLPQSTRLDCGR